MTHIRQRIAYFFSTFSFHNFILLAFGLPFLSEGLFLFFKQSLLNHLYHPLYFILFFALLFLYGNFFSQIQSNEKVFENFSLKGAFVSFAFWILLSPLFFFRFYQLMFVWRPLPPPLLSFIFLYRWKILPIIVLVYIAMLYLLYRILQAPKYLKQGKGLRESLALSWHYTSRPFTKQLIYFFLLPLAFIVGSLFIKIGFIGLTSLLTSHSGAMCLLLLYRVSQNVLWALFFLYLAAADSQQKTSAAPNTASLFLLGLIVVVCLGFYGLHYNQAFKTQQLHTPVTISHRGVSNQNGVQNSVDALRKTSTTFHPDFIEMDVQETADHHLVVMHDEDLKALAKKNIRIDEATWEELKEIRLKENGYTSHIPLFADYLAVANQLDQKLLIELKVTAKTRKSIVPQLAPLSKQLAHHQLQSMDLDVANQMKELFPTLKVGYILPMDVLGSPKNSLDFVNIEAKTANEELIQYLRHRKQEVYVWSIHSEQQAAVYRFLPVSGLLTDDLSLLTANNDTISARTASILQFD